MKKWRIAENEWNLKSPPWYGGYGIEEIDEELAVPSLVCWFYRGHPLSLAQSVVEQHNKSVDENIKVEL